MQFYCTKSCTRCEKTTVRATFPSSPLFLPPFFPHLLMLFVHKFETPSTGYSVTNLLFSYYSCSGGLALLPCILFPIPFLSLSVSRCYSAFVCLFTTAFLECYRTWFRIWYIRDAPLSTRKLTKCTFDK